MITFMRRYRRALQVALLVVIAAFVGSLFVFGSRSFTGDTRDDVASVNGELIPLDRYQRRYQEYLNAYSQMLRDRFSPEMAERLGLAQQVVQDLVQEALIVQRARAERLEVSDQELNAQIHAVQAFQENGRFSLKRYEEVLRRNGLTKSAFENDIRRKLTRARVESTVRDSVKVSDAEVEQAYAQRREEVRAAWALVEVGPLLAAAGTGGPRLAQDPQEKELEQYLKDHAAEYRHPERRRVQYVALSPKDFLRPVPEAEVEKYYTERAAEFETPRQVHVAHVLARVPETGGSAAEDEAKAKVAGVIRRARAGEDFARLAREVSQDPGTAPKGGDLGFVARNEVVPEFERAAFALKKGEVSPEPVRTPFGYHAIKVLDVRAGGKKPLKEVAAQIRERLQSEAADRAAKAKGDEVRPPLQGAADFMAEAKKLGLAPLESTVARRETRGLAPPDPMEEAAFSLAIGGVSVPVKTPAGWVVLRAIQHLPAAVPPLAEVRGRVEAAVKRQRAEAVALERARQIVAEAKGGDFLAAARKAGASTGEARFSRAKPADKLPGDAMLPALQTPAGQVTEPVKTAQGYYVMRVIERLAADLTDLPNEREKIAREVLAQKQGQAWEAWLGAARAGAKIDVSSRFPARRG